MPQKAQDEWVDDPSPAAGGEWVDEPSGGTTSGAAAMPAGDNPKGLTAGQVAALPKNQRLAYMRNANPTQFETDRQGDAARDKTLGEALMNTAATVGGLLIPGGSGLGGAAARMATGGTMAAAPQAAEHAALGEEQHVGRDFALGAGTAGLFEIPAAIGATKRAVTNWLTRRMDVSEELADATKLYDEAIGSRTAEMNKAVAKSRDIQTRRDLRAGEVQQTNATAEAANTQKNVATLNKAASNSREAQTANAAKQAAAIRENEANAQYAQRSLEIAKQRDQVATGLVDDVSQLEHSVRTQLDTGWAGLRQKMSGTQGNIQRVSGAVQKARKLVSSTNSDEFEGLLQNARGDATEPTWENLRAMYQNLGYTRAAGNMSPDVYTAIKALQEDIGSELHAMAATKQADADFTALSKGWSQYMDDFKNASGPGGSPVAKALRYPDRDPFIRNLTGAAADRSKEILQRWGGRHDLIDTYNALGAEMKTLPKFKAIAVPGESLLEASDIPTLSSAKKIAEPGPALNPSSNIPTLKTPPPVPKREALQTAKLAGKVDKAKKIAKTGAAIAGATAIAGRLGHKAYQAGSTILGE